MPRRPPPSALLLHPGPTPSRSEPKHSLPSFPRPAFYPSKTLQNPLPATARAAVASPALSMPMMAFAPRSAGTLPSSPESASASARKPLRGPWDHSRSLSESMLDVDSLIRMPKPAAVNVSPPVSSVW